MPEMIVLTTEQADAVRGPTTPGQALDPREIGPDLHILPLAVLTGNHGGAIMAKLRALPIQDVAIPPPENV